MKIIKASDVPGLIKDGDTIFMTGINLQAFPEEAFVEIGKSFDETGHPGNLTMYWPSSPGNRNDRGLAHVAKPGLLKRGVGGHILGCGPVMAGLCAADGAEIYNLPQGIMAAMGRAIAAGYPGIITKVGLGTAMDPRIDGGRMTKSAREDLVELIEIHGEEYLLYRLPKVDVTIVRGSVADEKGNVSLYREGSLLGQLGQAEAAKACGGIVIVQVERIVKAGTLHPKEVRIPGVLVDYLYVADLAYHWQTGQTVYNPSFSGESKVPVGSVKREQLTPRKVIARRAAMEIARGDLVNLGVGIPEAIASVAAEEGVSDEFTLTTEVGNIGGIPAPGHDFGCAWNPECTIDMSEMFDMYDGGCLDTACLGCLQISKDGSVNASKRNGMGVGVGGFINVSTGAQKLIFATAFTGGKKKEDLPEIKVGGGRLEIIKDGNADKFVREIEQISFNGKIAAQNNKEVLYITERAVFRLRKEGLELIEIAPGVNLERDILAHMEYRPLIENVKEMPAEIFWEEWGGLAACLKEIDTRRITCVKRKT